MKYLVSGKGLYICDFCQKKFPKRILLKRHILKECGRINIPCPYCPIKFKWDATLKKHIYHKHFSALQPPFLDKDISTGGGFDVHLERVVETLEENKENKSKFIKTTNGQILRQEEVSSLTVSSDHSQGQVYVENGGNGNKSTKEVNQENGIKLTILSQKPGNALGEVDNHNKSIENFKISLKSDCENYLDVNEPLTTDSNNFWRGSPVADENAVNETDSDLSSTTTSSDSETTRPRYEDLISKAEPPYNSPNFDWDLFYQINTTGSSDSSLELFCIGAKIEAELQKNAPEEDIVDLTDDN